MEGGGSAHPSQLPFRVRVHKKCCTTTFMSWWKETDGVSLVVLSPAAAATGCDVLMTRTNKSRHQGGRYAVMVSGRPLFVADVVVAINPSSKAAEKGGSFFHADSLLTLESSQSVSQSIEV